MEEIYSNAGVHNRKRLPEDTDTATDKNVEYQLTDNCVTEALFHSSLSMEEIERNFAEVDIASELTGSLKEALEFLRGSKL